MAGEPISPLLQNVEGYLHTINDSLLHRSEGLGCYKVDLLGDECTHTHPSELLLGAPKFVGRRSQYVAPLQEAFLNTVGREMNRRRPQGPTRKHNRDDLMGPGTAATTEYA